MVALSFLKSFGPWGLCLLILVFAANYRGDANTARARLKTAEERVEFFTKVAAENAEVVKKLQVERAAQDAQSVELQAELAKSRNRRTATTQAVRKVERSDASSKTYLGTRIPSELRRVLESDN